MDAIQLYKDDDYSLHVEMYNGTTPFLHCNVQNFSLSVYKKMWEHWPLILDRLQESGFDAVYSLIGKDDTQVQKFQTTFGLEPQYETPDYIIYRLEI